MTRSLTSVAPYAGVVMVVTQSLSPAVGARFLAPTRFYVREIHRLCVFFFAALPEGSGARLH